MFKNIILMMILIVSSSVATEINWAKDYNDGITKAKKADKHCFSLCQIKIVHQVRNWLKRH